jgi:transcriptional regulator
VRAADTSVVVAAFASWHEHHQRACKALVAGVRLIEHCALETYSVLTRLPAPHRCAGDVVRDFLRLRFIEPYLCLDDGRYKDFIQSLPERRRWRIRCVDGRNRSRKFGGADHLRSSRCPPLRALRRQGPLDRLSRSLRKAMYVPDAFRSSDLADLDRLATYNAFGTLISQADGAPLASHLPVLYRRAEGQVILTGHWARANPQWRQIEGQRVLFIFHGPHAYISPRWYAEPEKNVPTWNYAVAHVYGRIRLLQGAAELARIVSALAAQYEAGAEQPWRFEDAGEGRARLKAIVGFELTADEVQVKLKLNQNHAVGNVRGAIAGLRATGTAEAAELAAWMESTRRDTGTTE